MGLDFVTENVAVRSSECAPDLREWAFGRPPGTFLFLISDTDEHRAEIELRMAGFEIRDSLRWVYSEGVKAVIVGRVPLSGTVAQNVLEHGTGALNIAACRVGDQVYDHVRGKWPANVLCDGSPGSIAMLGIPDALDHYYDTSRDGDGVEGLATYLQRFVDIKESQ